MLKDFFSLSEGSRSRIYEIIFELSRATKLLIPLTNTPLKYLDKDTKIFFMRVLSSNSLLNEERERERTEDRGRKGLGHTFPEVRAFVLLGARVR